MESGDIFQLEILDKRYGYTPQQVYELFSAYTERGKVMYLGIELIDIFIYFQGYVRLFTVLLDWMAKGLAERCMKEHGF